MRYIIRLNKRAINPLTQQLNPKRRWEVEQRADKDSEKVVWHCEDVRIGDKPVQTFFQMPPSGNIWDWEMYYVGTVARGQDNFIVILGEPDGERD